jgi:DNA-binding XRE family transcriptional regulator
LISLALLGVFMSKRTIGNQKVARNRGIGWKEKLIKGKFDAKMNPTGVQLARQKIALSQETVARKIGISIATYGSIERAKRYVTKARAEAIAKILGFPTAKIFKFISKKKLVASPQNG